MNVSKYGFGDAMSKIMCIVRSVYDNHACKEAFFNRGSRSYMSRSQQAHFCGIVTPIMQALGAAANDSIATINSKIDMFIRKYGKVKPNGLYSISVRGVASQIRNECKCHTK